MQIEFTPRFDFYNGRDATRCQQLYVPFRLVHLGFPEAPMNFWIEHDARLPRTHNGTITLANSSLEQTQHYIDYCSIETASSSFRDITISNNTMRSHETSSKEEKAEEYVHSV